MEHLPIQKFSNLFQETTTMRRLLIVTFVHLHIVMHIMQFCVLGKVAFSILKRFHAEVMQAKCYRSKSGHVGRLTSQHCKASLERARFKVIRDSKTCELYRVFCPEIYKSGNFLSIVIPFFPGIFITKLSRNPICEFCRTHAL